VIPSHPYLAFFLLDSDFESALVPDSSFFLAVESEFESAVVSDLEFDFLLAFSSDFADFSGFFLEGDLATAVAGTAVLDLEDLETTR